MGETTPPPDDRFPKVFSMTSAAYQPAGARGGFAKQQQKEATPMEEEVDADGKGEERRNETGDGAAAPAADAGTASATVKDEAVINEAAAAAEEEKGGRDQNSGAELEQGSRKAIAHRRPFDLPKSISQVWPT